MFRLDRAVKYFGNVFLKLSLLSLFPVLSGLAILPLYPEAKPLLVLAVLLLGWLLLWLGGWHVAARFVKALYRLKSLRQARAFLKYRVFGRMSFAPYLIIREGKIIFGEDILKKIGGPGGLVIHQDTAVVLEQGGKLTRVIRGPGFPHLAPFEKVWDVLDLRPQRWVFPVSAITYDGIPITYDADVRFQIGDTEEDIFKAATCKWIRDAWRTEEDRLMIWTRRVIIGETEGVLRSILARYTLDQLIDAECRQAVRDELEQRLEAIAPGLGVKILHVVLGDIKLKGQVLQQWLETWRAERERERSKTIVEGQAERARTLEAARTEARRRMLDRTAEDLNEMAKRGEKLSSRLVVLSFIEMLKRTALEQSLYSPENMIRTLEMLRRKIEMGALPLVEGETTSPSPPSLPPLSRLTDRTNAQG